MSETNRDERAKALADQCDRLVREVNALNADSGIVISSLDKRGRVNRRLIIVLAIGFVVMAALTIGLLVASTQISQNTQRVDQVTRRLDSESTEGRQKVLCPLYKVFLDSDTKEARQGLSARELKARDKAFATIRQGYKVLDCKPAIPSKK